ncbi:SDR family NAD(P)-dependent oxidoreductase [Sorangium sp. So ce134]
MTTGSNGAAPASVLDEESAPPANQTPLQRALFALRKARGKLEDLERAKAEPVAIVGMSCRFPAGGAGPEAFWRALEGGVDGVKRIPPERWSAGEVGSERPEVRWAGLLDELDGFDAAFFGISPREASRLDPQQRLLLEVTWEALERAGARADALMGSRTGVFIGMSNLDYQQLVREAGEFDVYSGTGNATSTAAGRLSYVLGLEGPCMTIDTACSSSLVAVHQACQSLRGRESDMAIAGGVNVILDPTGMVMMVETQALSPDGRCKTFDARANGFVRGEGCGVLVLKRLSDAERDGDPILAVIRGSAVNQDGRSTGLTAPNMLSQQALLRQALESARLAAEDIGYVETHGTGTSLGDPIEFEALRAVLGAPRADGARCALGALKTNIGHLEAAAGVAGLIKAVLCLNRGVIPQNLHFETLNPRMSLDGTPFVIPTENMPWERNGKPRRAGVSAFALSGTNAHVIVEEAPRREEAAAPAREASSYLLPLSAKSPEALVESARAYHRWLTAGGGRQARLHDVAYTASARRSHHEHRLGVVGASSDELAVALDAFARGEAPAGLSHGEAPATAPKVVFVFPGQGSQWPGMGRALLAEEPAFRAAIEACDEAIRREAGFSVADELRADEGASRLGEIDVVQPVLFAVEVALAALWRSWGVEPDAVVGHSMGEVAAAHVAGALTLQDAAAVICRRSRILRKVSGKGAMAMVELAQAEAEQALAGHADRLSVAVSNGPRSTVIAGEPAALEEVLTKLEQRRVFCRRVKVDVASHSPQMDPLRPELLAALGGLSPREASIPMRSTVTGERLRGGELSAGYWADNLRKPVLFSRVIQDLVAQGPTLFVEMSPHPILVPAVEENLHEATAQGAALGSLRRQMDERRSLLESLARLYARGAAVGWERLYPERGRLERLPTYPWQRRRYWVDAPALGAPSSGVPTGHPLLGAALAVAGAEAVFEAVLDPKRQRYLADHRVFDEVVMPGVALLEMAHAAGIQHGGGDRTRVTQFTIQAPLRFVDGAARRVQVVLSERTAEGTPVAIYSRSLEAEREEGWVSHAAGYVQAAGDDERPARLDLEALRARCPAALSVEDAYARFTEAGIEYGPAFQGVVELWKGQGEALSRLSLPEEAGGAGEGYGVHPALLDAAVQTVAGALETSDQQSYLPFEFSAFARFGEATAAAWAHVRLTSALEPQAETFTATITLADAAGQVVAALSDLRCKRASAEALRRAGARASAQASLYRLAWQEQPASGGERAPAGTWVLLDQGSALAPRLEARLRASGARVVRATFAELGDGAGQALADAEAIAGTVCLWAEEPPPASDAGASVADQAERSSAGALGVIQALIGRGAASQLWFVTRGAQAVEPGETVAVAQAPQWGLGRVVMAEHPELGCRLVDLDPGAEDGLDALWQELCRPDDERQVAVRAGKRLALRLAAAPAAPGDPAPALASAAEGTVLITGGLGALGLHVARWLWEEHRVGHLLLVGRSAPEGERLAEVERLRAAGAAVTVAQADVGEARDVERLLASIPAERPLRGVVHAAGVLDDGVLVEQSAARIATVFGPKVRGAWNLHELTQRASLDFFVLFSSLSSVLGSGGQGNYAAANAFLDALAHARRALGLAGQSLNWGAWSDGGLASAMPAALRARSARTGLGMLTPAQGLSLLGQALARPEAELAAVSLDRRALERSFSGEVPPVWRGLVAPKPERGRSLVKGAWVERVGALDASARAAEVASALRADIARVLSSSANEVPEERPLRELGLDSLMAVELRNAISARVGKPLPATLLFDHPTLRDLKRHLLERVLVFDAQRPAAAPPSAPRAGGEEAIAIVGMGCRYPGGARDLAGFWRLLEQGADAMREVPKERWDIDAYYDPDPDAPGKTVTRRGAFLDDIDRFDAGFFGISPREAEMMDPQHRLLLETTWEALENAGIVPERLMGSDAGVFVGLMYQDYGMFGASTPEGFNGYLGTGTAPSVASGRISYLLGLKGPSLTLDTACSSSLVAIHLAAQSLRSGECSMALAGGATLMLTPGPYIEFSRLRGLAPDGRCKSFDAAADGAAWGEGSGVVVLKRLSDAERDGDRILAVIRGSAVNQDGRSQGLTAPHGPAQEEVIRRALAQAGVAASAVDYVEAHGTGTPLGDPIEALALAAALGEGRAAERPLLIGSVKSNLGHTQAAAGVAGVIKTVLAMQQGWIPQSLYFKEPNQRVPWSELPLRVVAQAVPWKPNGKPRIAGVSSFGISGTNAHVLVEETPRREEAEAREASSYLLPLSAKSPEALVESARAYHRWLTGGGGRQARLHDIAYTASVRRSHHEHRLGVVGASSDELAAALDAFARGEAPAGLSHGEAPATAPKVVFVFPGQGSQWLGMGRTLLAEEPAFRAAIEACDEAIRREAGFSVADELRADEGASRLGEIDVVQPVLFAVEVALAALWRSWGVEPDAVVGHSMGEVAAAHVAGALTLQDAAAVICRRSRLLRKVSGKGAMALVELTMAEAEQALAGHADRLSVAVSNGPRSTVIAGEPAALEEVLTKLEQRRVFCRRVKVDVASHSPQMDPLRPELLAALGGLSPREASIPMRSTVTGERLRGGELSAGYWADNLRKPVLFSRAIQDLIDLGHALFVEMSPHPILVPAVEENLHEATAQGAALGSLRRQVDERRSLLESLARLYARGAAVGWERLYPERGRLEQLPTYPWQRQRHWLESGAEAALPVRGSRRADRGGSEHPLLGERLSSSAHADERTWEQRLSVAELPYLADHRVQGEVVFPGAGFVEMALAAGAAALGAAELVLEGVSFAQMLALPGKSERIAQVVLTEQGAGRGTLQIASREAGATIWTEHARGAVRLGAGGASPARAGERPAALKARLGRGLPAEEHYQRMQARQIGYGPAFQGLLELWAGEGEALGRVRLPDGVSDRGYTLHPALLDACFQVVAGLSSEDAETYVPVGIGRVQVRSRPSREAWVVVTTRPDSDATEGERSCDLRIVDDEGQILVELESFRARRLEASSREEDALDGSVHEVAWRQAEPLPEPSFPRQGAWLVLSDQGSVAAGLCARLSGAGQRCVRVVSGGGYERVEADLYRIDPAKPGDHQRLLREALGEEGSCLGAVHLFSLDATPTEATTPETLSADLVRGSVSAAYLAQALVRHGFRDVPRLFLVTRGAQAAVEGEPVSVGQAPLLGLGRTIALEHPELKCTRIDLSASGGEREAELLTQELCTKGREDQIALRGEGRYAARLVRGAFERDESAASQRRLQPAGERPFRLEIRRPGVLERLSLHEMTELRPGAGEVLIEVEAAGLNFRDVLLALGVLPDGAAGLDERGPRLGRECAGRVAAVGEGVTDLALGQEVIALGECAFGSHMLARRAFVVNKPASLSWEQAATTPVAFLTAYYALEHVARLQEGERVLIHAGAGGVGLAAIQWAMHVGAEIFATAGSEEKRAYLRDLGVPHVLDSRSLRFAEDVKRITEGEGVDVVLNSLSGEFIPASLGLLRDQGRFVEIGLRDSYENKPIGLRPFLQGLSFTLVDLRSMIEHRPARLSALLRELVGRFEAGALKPLPVQTFSASRAADAFAHMAQAKHIGKVALALKDPAAQIVPLRRAAAISLRADRSYLITGGLGGLGLSLARWLVEQGARHLALVGRRGAGPEAQQAIREMEAAGAQVLVEPADVSRRDEVERLFGRLEQRLPPLRGIVHAAAVLDDHTLLEQSEESFRKVFGPKALGAWNLHARSAGHELDFFVMYSSAASLFGSPGQGNYTAANALLDALAHERQRRGLRSMSIQWGAFSEVGLAAAQESRGARLSSRGVAAFTPAEGLEALRRLLLHPRAEVGVVRFDARQWLEFYPGVVGLPFLAEVMVEGASRGAAGAPPALERLKSASAGERLGLLERHLLEQAGGVLRLDPSQMDRGAPFQSFGMDSLMSLELRNRLEGSLGIRLSATILFTYPTAGALAEHLLERLGLKSPGEEPEVAEPIAPDESALARMELALSLDQLSDEQLISRLAEKLGPLPVHHEKTPS